MAIYRAVTNGNFSNLTTWNVWNGSIWLAATSVPSSSDEVFSNNFIINLDQTNITILRLSNNSNTTPSIAGGGYFTVNNSITLNITNGINQADVSQSAATVPYLIQTSGLNLTMNFNFNISTNTTGNVNLKYLTIAHTGSLNFVGNITGSGSTNGALFDINSSLSVTILGNIVTNNQGFTAVHVRQNSTVSIVGNISTSNFTAHQAVTRGLLVDSTNATVTVTGNIFHNSLTINNTPVCVQLNSGNLHIIGSITGGFSNNLQFGVSVGGNGYFKHTGVLFGGNSTSNSIGSVALNQSATALSAIIILSGPFVFGSYGVPPFLGYRILFSNNVSKYIEFASDSTNGALFPNAAPTRLTMYSPNTIVDAPSPNNVRQGVTYALGSQVGTLAVPSPSDVRKNTPTDNTVGTADLTAQDFLDLLSTSSDPLAERLRNVSTVQSTGDQIASLS